MLLPLGADGYLRVVGLMKAGPSTPLIWLRGEVAVGNY